MFRRLRTLAVPFGLLVAAPAAVALVVSHDAIAADKKDPLADSLGGQLLFLSGSPPIEVSGPGWFTSHKISKKDENSDKKWKLNCMLFVKRPLDSMKVDLMFYKADKSGGNAQFVQKREQYLTGDARSFYFDLTILKDQTFEPNLKYTVKVLAGGSSVAEGTIELDGKEEKVGGSGTVDFSGEVKSPGKVEGGSSPFDNVAAKKGLNDVIYEDCRGIGSSGGNGLMVVTFSKDGKVVKAEFSKDPAPVFSEKDQFCIKARFSKARITPFNGEETHTVSWKIHIDDPKR